MITQYTTKNQVVDFYRNLMATNQAAAIKGLLHVYDNQTANEQTTKSTNTYNGVGFTGADARSCSIVASILQFEQRNSFITDKQKELLARKLPHAVSVMPKYANQIVTDLIMAGKIVKNDKFYEFVK